MPNPATYAAACVLPIVLLTALAGCKHVPTAEEADQAAQRRALAVDMANKGHYRRALAELMTAQKLNPDDPELNFAFGIVYVYGYKRYDDARTHLDKALANREGYAEAENLYGITYLEEGRYAEAIPYFDSAKKNLLYTTPEYAQQNLGWALYKSGKFEEGMAELEQAVQKQPNLCGAYYWLGLGHGEQGKTDASVKWFESYRERCDGTKLARFVAPAQLAEVQYRLGMAYLKLGEQERARASFADCVGRFPKLDVATECQKSLSVLP